MRYILIISVIINLILLAKIVVLRTSIRNLRLDYEERAKIKSNTLLRVYSRDVEMRKLTITLNKTLEKLRESFQQYEQGNMEIQTAITNITHDLRTPLTSISGYLELSEELEKSDDLKRYLDIIKERTDTMKNLTEELFDYSLNTVGETTEEKSEVFINRVLEDCVMNFYPSFMDREIEPVLDITEKRIVRTLYPSYVERIITNLLSNALKYSDGDLEITLSENGKLTFANSAKALSNVEVNKLFNRFFTVENARNNSTGLGLSIVKIFAQRMDCKLDAKYDDGKLVIEIDFPE